ncbi:MAG: DUF2934 domain-containing protein [Microvirga sp.]
MSEIRITPVRTDSELPNSRTDKDMEPRVDNTEEQVRRRAFELWEEHGRPEGYDEEFWLQAERQLKGGANSSGITANAPSAKSGSGSESPS